MSEFFDEVLLDALLDVVKLLPFLFITFLIMEYIEHKSSRITAKIVRASGSWGPVLGAAAGIVPQCGFSASASNLYSQRLITVGTLIAVYLSTSDEMIPIFLSEGASIPLLLKVLACKFLFGIIFGFIADKLLRRFLVRDSKVHITEMCADDHCECDDHSVFYAALIHTLKTALYILVFTIAFNAILHFIGEEALKNVIIGRPVIGSLITGIVGLIPNCAASIIITELAIEGVITTGAMLSGLLVGAGVGLLVLFRANKEHPRDNLIIVATLYASGAIVGVLFDLLNISF